MSRTINHRTINHPRTTKQEKQHLPSAPALTPAMPVDKVLEKIGFTKNEARIYLTMLKLGPAKAGRISKEAQVNRTCCYDCLKSLLEKGIISYTIEANRKVFQPENPRTLLQYLQHKEEDLESAMPQLEGLYNFQGSESNVRLFKGIKGIKTVFMDMLKGNEPIYYFGSEGQFKQRLSYFCPHFVAGNLKKRRRIRVIKRHGGTPNPDSNTEVRWVPQDIRSNVVTNIYGNKIAIIIWTEVPEAVIIHNKEAAESYRNYFEFMWNNAIVPDKKDLKDLKKRP